MAERITDIERKGAEWLLEAEADRYRATIATLTQRIAELEAALVEARKLAKEALDINTNHAAGLIPQPHCIALQQIAAIDAAKEKQ